MERNVLTVFLASPSDVKEERDTVKNIVDRINHKLARSIGWNIDLLRWESTLPACSRPQEIINEEVDSCDLFIGILWSRWGQDTGTHSSGFEEEFYRAIGRNKETRKPEIWIYFKEIDNKMEEDPGEQLKLVLEFKNEQITDKKLKYKEFKDTRDWEEMIFYDLLNYMIYLSKLEPKEKFQDQSVPLEPRNFEKENKEDFIESNKNYCPSELLSLFGNIIKELKEDSEFKPDLWDSTRVLLQSYSWFSEAHQDEVFDNHEINLVYLKRQEWIISDIEKKFLIRSFMSDIYDHRPGWYWLKEKNDTEVDNLLLWLVINDSNEFIRKNAMQLLTETHYDAEKDLLEIFLDDHDQNIALEAIKLIKNTKNMEHLKLLEQSIISDNISISEAAKNAKVELLYLQNPNSGFNFLIDSGSKVPELIENKLDNLELHVEPKLLFKGLKYAELPIRRFCANYLRKSKLLSKENSYSLIEEPDYLIKREGFLDLVEHGEELDINLIDKMFPILTLNDISELKYKLFKINPPEDLFSQLDFYNLNGVEAYKAIAINYFQEIESRIRSDLDSGFETLQLESESKLKHQFGKAAEEFINKDKNIIELLKGKFVSAALEGLILNGVKKDVKFARKYLGNTVYNIADVSSIKLLSRFGDTSDIDRLIQIATDTHDNEIKKLALEVGVELSDNKIELINHLIELDDQTIVSFAIKMLHINNLNNKTTIAKNLLNIKDDNNRIKSLSLLVTEYSDIDLEKLLNEYLNKKTYYYDVIVWLDRCLYSPGKYKEYFRTILTKALQQ